MKTRTSFSLCLILATFFMSGLFFLQAQTIRRVRVNVLDDVTAVDLAISGNFEIRDGDSNTILSEGRKLNVTVGLDSESFSFGRLRLKAKRIFVKTWDPDEIILNERRFRGDISLIRKDKSHFFVINHVELEDYIKGVLYHEVSHYWPEEILKAQAIVCRTYALYQMQQNSRSNFDVTSGIYSQMYGGSTSERYRTNRAVDETAGEILTYRGKIFPAYFHATCAGHTEDAAVLWKISILPLKGVVCEFCKGSPHYAWHEVITQDDFRWSLRKAGYRIKKITEIEIAGKDASNRISDLRLSDKDKTIVVSAKDLRNIIGPNLIRSTNFSVSLAGDEIIFEGVGWGHGVGMCQWGGYFMAKAGHSHQEILQYYYPGSQISSLDTLSSYEHF
jgi:stage II sporulation protein D